MKIDIFQSHKGDCVLLESQDGRRILCDGGMSAAMTSFVAPKLAKLRTAKKKIDYVYVSHLDQDHISGVLRLLRNELDWRVYDYQRTHKNAKAKKPKQPRPPAIGGIWHNAFRDQVGKNAKKVEDQVVASVPALLATGTPVLQDMGERLYEIATSIPEALEVSGLAHARVLNIPVNRLPGAGGPAALLMLRKGQKTVKVGSLRLTIVGPGTDELTKLRDGWDTWLRENGKRVDEINAELKRRMDQLGTGAPEEAPLDLRDWNGIPDYKGVTVPNIASLMFMVEENGKRMLLTGDSQQDMIIRGLEATGFLAKGAGLHLDILKVQHHGSENNLDSDFARRVSADHYVFCGNGEHENPDLRVIRHVVESRLSSDPAKVTLAPQAQTRTFRLWFSSSSAVGTSGAKGRAHMREVEKLVKSLATKSKGRMKATFSSKAFVTLQI